MTKLVELSNGDAADVVDVLCEAFFDYPVMRYVVGDGDYAQRLRILIDLFVTTRTMRNDRMFGVQDAEGSLVGAVTTSNPHDPVPPEFPAYKTSMWQRLGTESEQRYQQCLCAWESTGLDIPQLHVNMIGVRDAYRGAGLARLLLDRVHEMCDQAEFAHGVSLTTEVPRNVELYQHFGYEIVGNARVTDELQVWNLFRYKNGNE